MPPIKPKPTRYGDVVFRSRLEARWAVFLDYHFLVDYWVHEPQQFQSEEGWGYTPDFLFCIAQFGFILEVKPIQPTPDYLAVLEGLKQAMPEFQVCLGVGDFYTGPPLFQNYTTGEGPFPLHKVPFFPNAKEAIEMARGYRFDLPYQPPPRKMGWPGELQAHISQWVAEEKKRARRSGGKRPRRRRLQ